jgi:hypothetical protein
MSAKERRKIGHNVQIDLYALEVRNPPPHHIPPSLRKCLRQLQEEMLQAWDDVSPLQA